MSNPFDEIRQAVDAARSQLRAADDASTSMANLLRGRLRHVQRPDFLKELKRELHAFNANTGKWKEQE